MIQVTALTYRRPGTLARLLEAFRTLELPDTPVRFLIVDNDPAASARATVEAAMTGFVGRRLDYVVETEAGIPAGRNRALQEAADADAELLCFVDDDAYPASSWLRELLACRRSSGATLLFGPVRYASPAGLSVARRLFAASLVARGRFIERYSTARARRGQIVTSGTGNWMGDVRWITRHGLRFDPARTAGGGEDAAFRERARALGAALAWCPNAIVHEPLPRGRVSVRYQFRRAVAHGRIAAQLPRRPRLVILRHPAGRIVAGIALMLVPVLGLASFSLGLHMVGMGIGASRAEDGDASGPYAR